MPPVDRRNDLLQRQVYLFDLDGTLVDSDVLHATAFHEALLMHAPALVPSFSYELVRGLSTYSAFCALGIRQGAILDKLVSFKQTHYRSAVQRGLLEASLGAHALLERLRGSGRSLGLVTSGSRNSVETTLRATDLMKFFGQHIVTSDDVSMGKPAPDLYVTALSIFGYDKAFCVGVEDSEPGFTACTLAEIDCLLIGSSASTSDKIPGFANLTVLLEALQ